MSTSPPRKSTVPSNPQLLKVMVMDDDSFQLELMTELLRGLGIADISCVGSGRDAMQRIAVRPDAFHLILIDLHMPGMDGFEFMDGLAKANFSGALIIVSGQSEAVMRGATLVAKLRRFTLLGTLTKPVERTALAALLANLR